MIQNSAPSATIKALCDTSPIPHGFLAQTHRSFWSATRPSRSVNELIIDNQKLIAQESGQKVARAELEKQVKKVVTSHEY